jgi:hypothetical protein
VRRNIASPRRAGGILEGKCESTKVRECESTGFGEDSAPAFSPASQPPHVILSERAPRPTHSPESRRERRIWPPDARHSALGPAARCIRSARGVRWRQCPSKGRRFFSRRPASAKGREPRRASFRMTWRYAESAERSRGRPRVSQGELLPPVPMPPHVILSERAPGPTHSPESRRERRIWPPDARHSALGPAARHTIVQRAECRGGSARRRAGDSSVGAQPRCHPTNPRGASFRMTWRYEESASQTLRRYRTTVGLGGVRWRQCPSKGGRFFSRRPASA